MPLNTLRLNHAPSSHPNDRIVFIKPLPRPASEQHLQETADTFLRAIAAQCLPIMKSNSLSVTTLEEHEPNREFIGRNFNNGEIIQLVLQSKNGNWLPFNMVQMVMMHELSHNLHMNHGKMFWATRNKYAGELRVLWNRAYTGDGLWGSGRVLDDLSRVAGKNAMAEGELQDVPLCGGTFQSRRRKRKRATGDDGQELTWKEKRDRRIEKKFGKNGQSLGEDEHQRMFLEIDRKGPISGKPRVAQSKRGRELRAAAALARFDTNKKETEQLTKLEEEDDGSESGYEEDTTIKGEEAHDANGQRLLDSMGFGMVRVCEEEQEDDVQVKQEISELQQLSTRNASAKHPDWGRTPSSHTDSPERRNPLYDIPQHRSSPTPPPTPAQASRQVKSQPKITINRLQPRPSSPATTPSSVSKTTPPAEEVPPTSPPPQPTACPICSLHNPSSAITCAACSHVLAPHKDPRHWRCGSETCRSSEYVNGGDVAVCGVCGGRGRRGGDLEG